ncbi:MAG: polysaccharide deacetylase family protein [Oscillospiraceae bacterium]|jgi:peptidoglycan/xylan/chitin deacetylase (PgdA/CDA1 family)|nr:polysaccharide deacetylase family protein [Oscillospiraceae bacterium]
MKLTDSIKLLRESAALGRVYSPSRRIRRVNAGGERILSLVFHGGPTSWTRADGGGITDYILDTLREFGARATFSIVGSTAENYPDRAGNAGSPYAHGRGYEHIPAFGFDDMGGAQACPQLLRRINREGHELSGAGYRAMPYSPPKKLRRREMIETIDRAAQDMKRLFACVYEQTRYDIVMCRQPYGGNVFADLNSIYDLCEELGCHYLAPEHDFSGRDCGRSALDLAELCLARNPGALSGTIIALRDGIDDFSRDKTTPILRPLLESLERGGYRVLPARELIARAPFEDAGAECECFEAARRLDNAGFVTAFRDGRLRAERPLTFAQAQLLIAKPEPHRRGVTVDPGNPLRPKEISALAEERFRHVLGSPKSAQRGDVMVWLAELADVNGLLKDK